MPILASYRHTHGLFLDSENAILAYLGVSVVFNPLVIGSEFTKAMSVGAIMDLPNDGEVSKGAHNEGLVVDSHHRSDGDA